MRQTFWQSQPSGLPSGNPSDRRQECFPAAQGRCAHPGRKISWSRDGSTPHLGDRPATQSDQPSRPEPPEHLHPEDIQTAPYSSGDRPHDAGRADAARSG